MRVLKSHGVAELSPEVVRNYQKIKENASAEERCCTDGIDWMRNELKTNKEAKEKKLDPIEIAKGVDCIDMDLEPDLEEKAEEIKTEQEIEEEEEEERRELWSWMSERDGHTRVLEEDILRVARGARQSTIGEVQQITPCVLKMAIDASPNGSCAWVIASLSNRIFRGDFDSSIGRLQCTAWTAAFVEKSRENRY